MANEMSLSLEPESMFRSWVSTAKDPGAFKKGQRYLMIDGGGGTVVSI